MNIQKNETEGTVTMSVRGKEYKASLNLAALMRCEELMGVTLTDLETRLSKPSATDIANIIYASLWAIDENQVGSAQEAGALFPTITGAMEFITALASATGILEDAQGQPGGAPSGK